MSRTKAPRLVMEVGETGKGKLTAAFVHMVNNVSSKRLAKERT